MGKSKPESGMRWNCPLCLVMDAMGACAERRGEFIKHMRNAKIEFLEGIKSLVESHIEDLRKKNKSGAESFKKVEVTD